MIVISKVYVFVQVVSDLVQGEFMQLGSKETENERFAHYLTKTYRKTASLIANSVKAVSSPTTSIPICPQKPLLGHRLWTLRRTTEPQICKCIVNVLAWCY